MAEEKKYWFAQRDVPFSQRMGGMLPPMTEEVTLPEVGTKMILEVAVWKDRLDNTVDFNVMIYDPEKDSASNSARTYYEVEVIKKLIPRTGFVDA